MPRTRQVVNTHDAALVLATDFAKAAQLDNDMENYYRWRNVASQLRVIADLSHGHIPGGRSTPQLSARNTNRELF